MTRKRGSKVQVSFEDDLRYIEDISLAKEKNVVDIAIIVLGIV